MSAHETLVKELARQPESVAARLLDYLHVLVPETHPSEPESVGKRGGFFSGYWSRHYGAFGGEDWDEPPDLPVEQREEW